MPDVKGSVSVIDWPIACPKCGDVSTGFFSAQVELSSSMSRR